MASYRRMTSSLIVSLAFLYVVRGRDSGLRGNGPEAVPRQLNNAASTSSCGDGMTVDVQPPWLNMDARVLGASSVDSCQKCADNLEGQGVLMKGWECYTWWWRVYLKRSAEFTLTDAKPVQSFKISDVTSSGPLLPAASTFPATMRGVFWLSGQKDSSALTTFASSNKADCEWCSYGKLIGDRYLVRVMGDRVWAFATKASAGFDLASGLSLVYDFKFDNAKEPTHATIYPIPTTLGRFGPTLSKQTWLLNFDMTLASPEEAEAMGFPGSVVWIRKSYALGIELKSSRYYLVQVIDENGDRIPAAWAEFVEYQNSAEAGDQPGELFYHGDE